MMTYDAHIIGAEILHAINALTMDLSGLTVLTEAASGIFALTPLIALLSGAEHVYAVSRTTRYGTFEDVSEHTLALARQLNIETTPLTIIEKHQFHQYGEIDLITNLGHVRPLDDGILSQLHQYAVISYMCETWEHRKDDLDLRLCQRYRIPVCGTDEEHPAVNCFRETSVIALKLLIEAKISLFDARIVILSRDKFGRELETLLRHFTSDLVVISDFERDFTHDLPDINVLIVADYLYEGVIIGANGILSPSLLKQYAPYVKIIQYCGHNQIRDIIEAGLAVYPEVELSPNRMVNTLADVSYKATIRLHAAGLKVGEALSRGMRMFHEPAHAIDYALQHSPAMIF
jgi:hypothetical protein